MDDEKMKSKLRFFHRSPKWQYCHGAHIYVMEDGRIFCAIRYEHSGELTEYSVYLCDRYPTESADVHGHGRYVQRTRSLGSFDCFEAVRWFISELDWLRLPKGYSLRQPQSTGKAT